MPGTYEATHATTDARTRPAPTLLETELDSISLSLAKMNARLREGEVRDQLSDSEMAELGAALERARHRMAELGELIRGSA